MLGHEIIFIVKTTKILNIGRTQTVQLPKEFQFQGSNIYIKKFENIVILFPKNDPWTPLIQSLDKFSDDFMQDRNQPSQQARESI